MLRKLLCVALVLGLIGGLTSVQGQAAKEKEKDKSKEKDKPKDKVVEKIKAKLVKVDLKKSTITVEMGTKTSELNVTKDVKFIGPRGGAADKGLKDDRMTPGNYLGLVFGAKDVLKEVHLPVRKTDKEKPKDKSKDKPKEKEKAK